MGQNLIQGEGGELKYGCIMLWETEDKCRPDFTLLVLKFLARWLNYKQSETQQSRNMEQKRATNFVRVGL